MYISFCTVFTVYLFSSTRCVLSATEQFIKECVTLCVMLLHPPLRAISCTLLEGNPHVYTASPQRTWPCTIAIGLHINNCTSRRRKREVQRRWWLQMTRNSQTGHSVEWCQLLMTQQNLVFLRRHSTAGAVIVNRGWTVSHHTASKPQ